MDTEFLKSWRGAPIGKNKRANKVNGTNVTAWLPGP